MYKKNQWQWNHFSNNYLPFLTVSLEVLGPELYNPLATKTKDKVTTSFCQETKKHGLKVVMVHDLDILPVVNNLNALAELT